MIYKAQRLRKKFENINLPRHIAHLSLSRGIYRSIADPLPSTTLTIQKGGGD